MRNIENLSEFCTSLVGGLLSKSDKHCSTPGVTIWAREPKNQKVFYVFTTDLKISFFVIWVYKGSDKTLLCDSVARISP